MFTGIVESVGNITEVTENGSNISFWVESNISPELKIDQSVAHDGICLTVEAISDNRHQVTAIAQTITITALNEWKQGRKINLERCLKFDGRVDGHMVQGHVDTTAICSAIEDKNGSWQFTFNIDEKFNSLIIEKGSVTINGTSLTLFDINNDSFKVAIIPYTFEHTNFHQVKVGQKVNIEFDMVGKYINRYMELRG